MSFIKTQINRIKKLDPSVHKTIEALIHPSFKAMFYYKLSHFFYKHKLYFIARLLSYRCKKITGIEIHPGAKIADDLFIDHGSSIVIGETCVIKKGVIIYHEVTLGALKNVLTKRHPTIEENVIIGCGAKILGNIKIGKNAKVGASSVVLDNVKANTTVVGIPASVVNVDYRED